MNDALFDGFVSLKAALADADEAVSGFYGDMNRTTLKDTTRHLTSEVFEVVRGVARAKKGFDEALTEARERDMGLDGINTFAEDARLAQGGKLPTEEQDIPAPVREMPSKAAMKAMTKAELIDLAADYGLEVSADSLKKDIMDLLVAVDINSKTE